MIFGFGILNLIIIVYFWIDKSIKEIGVRKAYGATNLSIAKHILKRYEVSILVSVVIGLLLHFICKGILDTMFPMFSFDIYLGNIVIVTTVFMIIGLLATIVPLIKAKKVQPVIIMKGRLK
ncbi:FtsX-like permease family protein [compost metagenome]